MSKHIEITDEEFVPFLHSLGVEAYKKSFEWMLSDPTFSGVLSWLYNNLDHNNGLSAREEYRYKELQKNNQLLSEEDLENALCTIQQDLPGICLPGDHESLEDVKHDISMQTEKLHALEKQEKVLKDLFEKNEQVKEQLTIKITKLNASQQQYTEDEASAASKCLTLAEEVEDLTEGVVDIIAGALDLYGNCHVDKDIAKKFVCFGPLEAYRQSQALFNSHFDLYTTRKFSKRPNDSCTDEDLKTALAAAEQLEERLSDAVQAYIESKANLCGEQAKLEFVANYTSVHPSQVASLSLETHSALELIYQEEAILEQQQRAAIQDLVVYRTQLARDAATRAALAHREQILSDLSHLLEVSSRALAADRLLYRALRHELRAVQQTAQFAAQLAEYLADEGRAISSRIESMSEITLAQEFACLNLKNSDILVQTLASILGCKSTDDVTLFVKMYADLRAKVKELKGDVKEVYRRKEEGVKQFKSSLQPLKDYVFDGCTRQPNCYDRTVTSLTHSLRQQLDDVERTVLDVGGQFTAVKNGDKNNMRKLWQWFLTDPPRLLTAVKSIPST